MRKLLLSLLLAPAICYGTAPKALNESLAYFSPKSVSLSNGNLTIVTNERIVTPLIYTSIIENGICAPLWLGNQKVLDGIIRVTVLNMFKKHGYVFEGGRKECAELGKIKGRKNLDIHLMGYSRIY